jgi:hypothetical protein
LDAGSGNTHCAVRAVRAGRRTILIEPKDYPDLFTAQNYRRLLSAEYAVALRSAFLSAAQSRR